ncbi:MAG: hypothetical protein JEZ07_14160 [Phycisphaerae bacterium]|nr:hypothetical protein [Phycisphaerae bacterium]
MRKLLLTLIVTLTLALSANAGLVNIVNDSYTDTDASGTITEGDIVHLKITADTYVAVIDFSLAVSGPGTLSIGDGGLEFNDGFLATNHLSATVADNVIARIQGGQLGVLEPGDLVWNLDILCTSVGVITADLAINATSQYKNSPDDATFSNLANNDLGDLTIEVLDENGELPETYTLTLTVKGKVPNGTAPTMDPAGGVYTEGQVVTLTANPDAGYRVKSWTGCDTKKSMLPTNTITMTKDKKVSIQYELTPVDEVTKATFKAGKERNGTDSLYIKGYWNLTPEELLEADTLYFVIGTDDDTNIHQVTVNMDSENTRLYSNNTKLKYMANGAMFQFSQTKGSFIMLAANVDLSDLTAPINFTFGRTVGAETLAHLINVEEAVINGKKPMPINYLFGQDDSLTITKSKAKANSKTGKVTASAQGNISMITVPDISLVGYKINIATDGLDETIIVSEESPIKKTKNKNKFSYKRPKLFADTLVVTSLQFDFDKGTYKLSIKDSDIDVENAETITVTITAPDDTVIFNESADLIE